MLAEAEPVCVVDDASTCFHCGEANPSGGRFRLVVDGRERSFCCPGCLAIAQTIDAAGLAPYYRQRTAAGRPAEEDDASDRHAAQAVAAGLVRSAGAGQHEAALLLEGLHCGACVWLIETWLAGKPYVAQASVNFATRRALVRWRGEPRLLATILRDVAAIGYQAHAYDPAKREALLRRETRTLLLRMGVALLASMQVMMLAVPFYLADDPLEPQLKALLDWASLLITLPVVLYSAAPFFTGAWRSLRARTLGMDVPVAIGVAGAFAASAWATVTGAGSVYYDSVTMFVALLLVARFFELRARARAARTIESVARELPATADRLRDGTCETVSAHELATGDLVRVSHGATIPADGVVVEGASSVEEALLTGESRPLRKVAGDAVLAGSMNRESPLVVRVTAAGPATTLASLARLVERAADARPRAVRFAERAAAWFVGILLVVAAATALYWWQHDATRVLPIVFAVLVVSCPCALSLATPAAMAVAAGSLGRRGALAVRPDALETLGRAGHVIFDKTGTLTAGRPRVRSIVVHGRIGRSDCIAIAAALEAGASHPVAEAIRACGPARTGVRDVAVMAGEGVEGSIDGRRYRCGRPAWVAQMARLSPAAPETVADVPPDAMIATLGDDSGSLATFVLDDPLREGSREVVAAFRARGMKVTLLSGDRESVVERVAAHAGIDDWHAQLRPDDKRAFIRDLQVGGACVAMIGDGLNDAPALAQADVSMALGDAAALTRWTADVVVLGGDVREVARVQRTARRTRAIVRENLGWAIAYNLVAIPLAATGLVSPLVASVGMSLSSLVVVANALRLARA
ncbi:MAG: heavy metal translocating P-type ATPase [Burkholderiales bacterium]